jgi:hypothetical protein
MADRAMGGRDYSVFGLRVRSSLPLPELFPARGRGEADVFIESGSIDEPEGAPGLTVAANGLLLTVPEVGRFLISDGRSIRAQPIGGVDPRNVRLFLLGSAFGVLLHQRGLLPLHANAIELHGKAVAFMGASGAGKSTLAALFHDRGFRVLADDVCVVSFDASGNARACPGLPRLRLWRDALEMTGRAAEGLSRSYAGTSSQLDKFDVPISRTSMQHAGIPIAAIYLLDEGSDFAISRLTGIEAAEAIFENTYRGAFVAAASTHEDHWRSAVALVRSVPVFRVRRSMDVAKIDAEADSILAHIAGTVEAGAETVRRA